MVTMNFVFFKYCGFIFRRHFWNAKYGVCNLSMRIFFQETIFPGPGGIFLSSEFRDKERQKNANLTKPENFNTKTQESNITVCCVFMHKIKNNHLLS